tara:strand:- start:816 stop:1661 length:846 start_codon:yes stop_codon:yes gene_type:complete
MKDKYIILLFMLMIIIIITSLTFNSFKETFKFKNQKNIILIGDFNFSDSFEMFLKDYIHYNKLNSKINDINVINLSKNCANIKDLDKQINLLSKKEWLNSENTYMFISIGSNDILNNLYDCKDSMNSLNNLALNKDEDSEANKAFENLLGPVMGNNNIFKKKTLLKCKPLNDIKKEWKNKINEIQNKFPKINKIIINFYDIPRKQFRHCDKDINITDEYYNSIEEFNEMIMEFSKNSNFLIVPANKIIKYRNFKNNEIEIDSQGNKGLANFLLFQTIGITG